MVYASAMHSIRARLTVSLLVGAGLLLLAATVLLEGAIRAAIEREFDRGLLTKARTLVTLTTQADGAIELDFADEFMPEFDAREHTEYFQLWYANGTVVERSRSLAAADLPRTNAPPDEPRFSDYRLPDGRAGRLVNVAFVPHRKDAKGEEQSGVEATHARGGHTLSAAVAELAVARGREDLDALIFSIRSVLAVFILLLLGSLAVLVRFSISHGLRALAEIGQQVQRLGADALDSRIKLTVDSAELAPIVAQLNSLLDRLDQAFRREQRFSGDVAHELRTPLAELRALAEVGARWPADGEAARRYFQDVLDATDAMARIVTNLLTLARHEAGKHPLACSEFNLAQLVATVWSRLAKQAERKHLRWQPSISPTLRVATDRDHLELILTNLLSNAIAYSPANESIALAATCDGAAQVAISNRVPDLRHEDLAHLFDRFWRKDPARSGGEHAGLGLAIVRTLSDHLGLAVACDLSSDGVFTITLSGLAVVEDVVTS